MKIKQKFGKIKSIRPDQCVKRHRETKYNTSVKQTTVANNTKIMSSQNKWVQGNFAQE